MVTFWIQVLALVSLSVASADEVHVAVQGGGTVVNDSKTPMLQTGAAVIVRPGGSGLIPKNDTHTMISAGASPVSGWAGVRGEYQLPGSRVYFSAGNERAFSINPNVSKAIIPLGIRVGDTGEIIGRFQLVPAAIVSDNMNKHSAFATGGRMEVHGASPGNLFELGTTLEFLAMTPDSQNSQKGLGLASSGSVYGKINFSNHVALKAEAVMDATEAKRVTEEGSVESVKAVDRRVNASLIFAY